MYSFRTGTFLYSSAWYGNGICFSYVVMLSTHPHCRKLSYGAVYGTVRANRKQERDGTYEEY